MFRQLAEDYPLPSLESSPTARRSLRIALVSLPSAFLAKSKVGSMSFWGHEIIAPVVIHLLFEVYEHMVSLLIFYRNLYEVPSSDHSEEQVSDTITKNFKYIMFLPLTCVGCDGET